MNCTPKKTNFVALKATKSLTKAQAILADLRAAGITLHQKAEIEVYKEWVRLGFRSQNGHLLAEIKIEAINKYKEDCTINAASYGDFNPNKKGEAVVSAMHLAQLLTHWDAVCQIMGKHFPYEPTK